MSALPRSPSLSADLRGWPLALVLAALAVLGLLLFLQWAARPPVIPEGEGATVVDGVSLAAFVPPPPTPPEAKPQPLPDAPPPPPEPAALAPLPSAPAAAAPAASAAMELPAIDAGAIQVNIGTPAENTGNGTATTGTGEGLFGSAMGSAMGSGAGGALGAFGAGGAGAGGAGYARGQSFTGKPLVPLSTARPQMPDWACKQRIKGWVEVVFVVMPNGRVQNVRVIDAEPRGVYEAAAVESVSNWIYDASKRAREVKQRIPMDPDDCVYNHG